MRFGLRQKISAMMLGVAALIALAVGIGVLVQLLVVRAAIVATVEKTGADIAQTVGHSRRLQVREHMEDLMEGGAFFLEGRMTRLRNYANVVADMATDIYDHPDEFTVRDISGPSPEKTGLSEQLLFSESVADRRALRGEYGRAAHIADVLVALLSHDPLLHAGTLSSRNGFTIDVDRVAGRKLVDGRPATFEGDSRPWYREAREAGRAVFTDIFEDHYSGDKMIVVAAPFFKGGEFAGVVALSSHLADLQNAVLAIDVGDTGFGFLVNERGKVILGPADADAAEAARRIAAAGADGGRSIEEARLGGRRVYVARHPLPALNWQFGMIMDVEEVDADVRMTGEHMLDLSREATRAIRRTIRRGLWILFGVVALALLVSALLSRRVTTRIVQPLQELAEGAAKISAGDLGVRLRIDTGDEVELLADSFNKMTGDLRTHMDDLARATAERERIGAELDVARRIQASMLPRRFPPFPDRAEFDIRAVMTPAREVGGDLYDFFMIDRDHVAVVVADVCGKGVPAALFMVVVKTLVKEHVRAGVPLDRAVAAVNARLCENNDADMFATAFLGVHDIPAGVLRFVNAGHPYPLIAGPDGRFSYLRPAAGNDMALGMMDDASYHLEEAPMPPGSTLLLYTDGVTESFDRAGEQYGEDRLLALLAPGGVDGGTLGGIVSGVEADVRRFSAGCEQSDDITILAFRTFS